MPRLHSARAFLFGACLLLASSALRSPGNLAHAGTAVRMGISDLARGSDLVVEARVLSAAGVEDASGRIDTEYLLRVDRTLWGDDAPFRSVRLPGGQLPDGRGMLLAGVPRLAPGEDVLLFLSAAAPSGMRMPVGLGQGRLGVVRDAEGRKSFVQAPGALALVDPATGTVREADRALRFDYAATLAEIEAALSVRRVEEARAKAQEQQEGR